MIVSWGLRQLKHIFTFIFSFCFALSVLGQGTNISIKLEDTKLNTLVIGKYVDGRIYVADSLAVDRGVALWKTDSLIPQGLYEIVLSPQAHQPLLIGEDRQFSIHIKSPLKPQHILIEGADESRAYNDYQVFIQDKMKEKQYLSQQRKKYAANNDSLLHIKLKHEQLDITVKSYIDQQIERYDGQLLAAVLKLVFAAPIPDFSQEASLSHNPDSTLRSLRFKHIYQHHFDPFDAGDGRLFFTPFYKQHIDYFYTKVCPPVADSVINVSLPLIEEARRDTNTFKFMLNYVMNYAEKSKIMGMDAVVLKLLQNYYINKKAWWISEQQFEKAKEAELYLRYNQIGLQAPNFTLPMWQNNGEPFALYDMPQSHTLLIFWEPDCGHCKTFIPELYKHLSEHYDTLPFEVLAVSTKADTAMHHSFIEKHQLYDWLHLCNDNSNIDFKVYYDLRVVPKVYLLDEHRKIIAKQLSIETIDQLINSISEQ